MNGNIYVRQWDVASFTHSGQKPYKVSERYDGRWECSCPAWTRHTPRADCKHIRKVQDANRFTPTAPVFAPIAPKPPASPTAAAAVARPKPEIAPEVTFEGYTIRRRALEALADTYAEAPAASGRGRRDI